MTHEQNSSGRCCPELDLTRWDEKTHVWENKPFIKGSVPTLFHIPWPPMVGKLVTRLWKTAQEAKADPKLEDFLLLAYDPTPFKSEFFMTVAKEVPGVENARLSGTFISKVFDGPYNAPPKWVKEFDAYLKSRGKSAKKYYFYFCYCPKCAKAYGHNYCVVFAQIG